MNNTGKRIEGAAEELGGKVKKGLGSLIGNEKMQAEGRAAELEGEAKQEAAKSAERVKGSVVDLLACLTLEFLGLALGLHLLVVEELADALLERAAGLLG